MDRAKFTTSVKTFMQQTPYRPFTVVTVAGDRHEVDRPDAIAIRDGVALFMGPDGVPVIFDHENIDKVIDVSDIGLGA